MDQLTDRQRTGSGRIALRDVYRGPLAIAFATSIAAVSGATLLYPVLPVLAADLKVDDAQIGLTMAAFTAPAIVLAPLFGIFADRFFLDYGLYTYLPILAALRYGASPTTIGILIAISAVGSIITAISIGRIYGRVATETLLALAFFASAIGVGLPALGAPLWLIAIGIFLFGLGNGLISPLQKSLMTRRTPPALRGGVIAVDRIIQQVAKSAAPALLGALLLVAPLEALFWTMCAMSAVGTLALIVVALMRGPANDSW